MPESATRPDSSTRPGWAEGQGVLCILLDEEHRHAGRLISPMTPNISCTMMGASPSDGSSSMRMRGP